MVLTDWGDHVPGWLFFLLALRAAYRRGDLG